MLFRRFFIGLVAASVIAVPCFAEGDKLSAAETKTLLAGNTIEGNWDGMYMQFFETDGSTMYYPESDTYESRWHDTGWVGYEVLHDEDGYFWKNFKGETYPFSVLEGRQVN